MATQTVRELDLVNQIRPELSCLNFAQKQMKWAIPQGSAYSSTVANRASSYSTAGISWNFNTQGRFCL